MLKLVGLQVKENLMKKGRISLAVGTLGFLMVVSPTSSWSGSKKDLRSLERQQAYQDPKKIESMIQFPDVLTQLTLEYLHPCQACKIAAQANLTDEQRRIADLGHELEKNAVIPFTRN